MLKTADPYADIFSSEEAGVILERKTVSTNEILPEGICYLRLNGMYNDSGAEVVSYLNTWNKQGYAGVIMDIRDAGGSYHKTIDDIATFFTEENALLYRIRDMQGRIIDNRRTGKKTEEKISHIPLMLLINEKTSEASEVLAAVLKGRARVMLIGSSAKGDTKLRKFVPLKNGQMLYVATKQVIPADCNTNFSGKIEPDIIVSAKQTRDISKAQLEKARRDKPLSERAKNEIELASRVAGDAVLARAVDILLGLKALGLYETDKTAANTDNPAGE
ncbi:S41 family peptidase [Verrucomicrobiota bacterium]